MLNKSLGAKSFHTFELHYTWVSGFTKRLTGSEKVNASSIPMTKKMFFFQVKIEVV